jgi:hypothetical protein
MPRWVVVLASLCVLTDATLALAQNRQQVPPQSGNQVSKYVVEGLALGSPVKVDSAVYREFQCSPSDQFDGFTWCQRSRRESERRGSFNVTSSILHAANGNAFYINRSERPAFFDRGELNEDIQRIARRIGASPRLSKMPHRADLDATIALWGNVELEPLDSDSVKIVAEGKSPKKGFLIDFIGDFARSAKEGLPVYRIGGGAGFIWTGSVDRDGRGALRFVAVDASRISPQPQVPPTSDVSPNSNQTTIQAPVEAAENDRAKLNAEVARIQAEGTAAKVDAENARVEAETARADAERTKAEVAKVLAEEREKVEAALTRLEAERVNTNDKFPIAPSVTYAAIISLIALLTLVAFLLAKLKRNAQTGQIKNEMPQPRPSPISEAAKLGKAAVESAPQAPPLVPQAMTAPLIPPVVSPPANSTKSMMQPKCQCCQNDITPGAKFCSQCGVGVGTAGSNN